MKAKEYYNKTRLVESRNWTLDMIFSFADEFHNSLEKERKQRESKKLFCPSCGNQNWDRKDNQKRCLECFKQW